MRRQLDSVLQQKVAQPRMELYSPVYPDSSPNSQLIQAIIDLITKEDYSHQVCICLQFVNGRSATLMHANPTQSHLVQHLSLSFKQMLGVTCLLCPFSLYRKAAIITELLELLIM